MLVTLSGREEPPGPSSCKLTRYPENCRVALFMTTIKLVRVMLREQ